MTVVAAAIGLLAATSASADSLGLKVVTPDIVANNVTVKYDYGTSTLTASGTKLLVNLSMPSSPNYLISACTYLITAQIDHNGVFSGGSLSISGDLRNAATSGVMITTGTAMAGTLTKFGFSGSGGAADLEFNFDTTGGYLTTRNMFNSKNSGIIISSTGGFPGNFSNPSGFTLTGTHIDVFAPTPSALPSGLVLMGATLGFGLRRGRSIV